MSATDRADPESAADASHQAAPVPMAMTTPRPQPSSRMHRTRRMHRVRPKPWAVLALLAMMLVYATYFSVVSIRLHKAHRTHTADLGQIDLAIWNTSQGRLVQEIKGEQISTRLTDHVEPIFVPISLVFYLWDDVRALLILQSVVLALGAWPVFHLAHDRLVQWAQTDAVHGPDANHPPASSQLASLAGLAFALGYLLYPPLQAANVAEFHALPLATPLILLAFLFAERRQWIRFTVAALAVALVQEGTALLAAMLGLYAIGLALWRRRAAASHPADASHPFAGEQESTARTDYVAPLTGLADQPRTPHTDPSRPSNRLQLPRAPLVAGIVVLIAGLAWFYLATFVVVPAYASTAYGLGESPYVARFGALGDSFGDVVLSLFTRPVMVLQVVLEPMRLGYLLKLIAPFGFLSLLGPEILLLGLPLLLANALSAFPFQYSGQLHYSAPLAAYAAMAAVVGGQRAHQLLLQGSQALSRRQEEAPAGSTRAGGGPPDVSTLQPLRYFQPSNGSDGRTRVAWGLLVWLLAWSLGSQIAHGYTPIGSQFRYYWTEPTAHHRLLERFISQIPTDAPVSVMPALYPHVSHRELVYQFPNGTTSTDVDIPTGAPIDGIGAIGDRAEYVLLDIAAQSGWNRHPVEVRDRVEIMLQQGQWTVMDAADGYLLLRRAEGPPGSIAELPDQFFSFARVDGHGGPKLALAQGLPDDYPSTELAFAPPGSSEPLLKWLGYEVLDDPQWRSTGFRHYWQALGPLPDDLKLHVSFLTPDGEVVDSTEERPLISTLWYPPSRWRAGEAVVTDKLPWFLPTTWAIAVGAYQGDQADASHPWDNQDGRWRIVEASAEQQLEERDTWAVIGEWERQDGELVTPPQAVAFEETNHSYGGDGWNVTLTGVKDLPRVAPGERVPMALAWRATGPSPRDYTIFVHVRDAEGSTVAQGDAQPTWYGLQPTSQWTAGEEVDSAHTVELPVDLPPGVYDVVVGWYYWETQERLALLNTHGQPMGDGAVVARLQVDATAGPQADLCCLLDPRCCASQE